MTGQCQIFAPTVYFDCLFTSTVCANGWSQLVAFTVQSSQLTTVCTCFVPFSRTFSCFVLFFDTGREKGSSPEVRPAEITRLIRHGHRSGMAKDPAWPKIRHRQNGKQPASRPAGCHDFTMKYRVGTSDVPGGLPGGVPGQHFRISRRGECVPSVHAVPGHEG